ncbi:dethiobiotin synthase [Parvibium lacunae]|uniref:ATP-dependent dethiobiotin synthetase BioD n=1 Tax=Parvibium lacunae TaxID=1888893 RepID=A0A368L7U3_9BURK|nr:dethiobiotin synthase [Parvibium lacunae]RCS59309.1 dethiobiotin synthase [Parvibium lacunae]
MPAIFVSGSDTNVGKTIVSAWLAYHWQATYWKPIQSGRDEQGHTDSQWVAQLTGRPVVPEAYVLTQPLSPHQSAALDNVAIDLATILRPAAERLVVEGAGGLLVPLNEREHIVDLIAHLQLPTLLVVRSGLGTINHTSLSVEALRARRLPLLGVVMVGEPNPANRAAIERYAPAPVLAELPLFPQLNQAALASVPLPPRLQHALESLTT